MKKSFKTVSALIILALILTMSPVLATELESDVSPNYLTILGQYSYAERVDNSIKCRGEVILEGAYSTKMKLYLQACPKSGGAFSDYGLLKEKTVNGSGTFDVVGIANSVPSNYTYRTKLTVDVYNANYVRLDHAESFSRSC